MIALARDMRFDVEPATGETGTLLVRRALMAGAAPARRRYA